MAVILDYAMINALTVLPLALLAFAGSRVARKPALTHVLWVVVLLKFITPPLFQLPVTIDLPVATNAPASTATVTARADVAILTQQPLSPSDGPSAVAPTPAQRSITQSDEGQPVASSTNPIQRAEDREPTYWSRFLQTCLAIWTKHSDWRSLALSGWLVGSTLWILRQLVCALRFQRRVIHGAASYPELQEQTDRLAEGLRLSRVPQVLVVEAAVSPMLWGCGARAKLLFPSDLAERLDDQARATLITHELAHFARGDHWVRLLELIATSLFWWHPIVWLAKQQIEEAEEECCDAWVVGQFPDSPKLYAEALLDTIDYLCERRQSLPPVACGLGQAHFLRHRLTKIMHGAAPKALSLRLRWAIVLVGVIVLPLQPMVFGSANTTAPRIDFSSTNIDVPLSASPSAVAVDRNIATDSVAEPSMGDGNVEKAVPTSNRSAITRLRGEKTWSTAASADGRFVMRVTTARRVVLTDRVTNSEADLSSQAITSIAFVPGQSAFVAAGSDGRATLWNAETAQPIRELIASNDVLRSVSVSPRGDVVAVGGKGGLVSIIDLETGSTVIELPRQTMAVNSVRFSPDANRVAVAIGDWESNDSGRVVLFDVETGKSVRVLDCESAPGAVAFASNSELIVGLWNGRADLWNLESHRMVGSAQADKAIVSAASFSPDNPALREVDFVATQLPAAEDKTNRSLLEVLFNGLKP